MTSPEVPNCGGAAFVGAVLGVVEIRVGGWTFVTAAETSVSTDTADGASPCGGHITRSRISFSIFVISNTCAW